MTYSSTRGAAPALDFPSVLLAGLAADGGLYMPDSWPSFTKAELRGFAGQPYPAVAEAVMGRFVSGIDAAAFSAMIGEAYGAFAHEGICPLRQLGPNKWLMELFHGPTLAFKDVAMQLLGPMFDHVLSARGEQVTIVGATSGDTGSAAIEAFRDRAAVDLIILHPRGRVSEVQRRQMTTVPSANVHNLAIEGTFDDCQALVKAMFADAEFRREMRLSAVNSINWARVMAQTVYYVYAAVQLGAPDRRIAFSVPTGNFGDVFAGYAASRMGLPIARLVVATNRNDILHRFFRDGEYRASEVVPTQSPSMDIQVASNFERLLFDLYDRDGAEVARLMSAFAETRRFRVPSERLQRARAIFASARVDEAETTATIADVWRRTGILIDPHTAVGVAAVADEAESEVPMVVLSTAHPAKFPEAVTRAAGVKPALPGRLADLGDRAERLTVLPNDLSRVQAYVRGRARVAA